MVAASYIGRLTAKYLIIVRADDNADKALIQETLKKYNMFVKLRASNNTPGHSEMIFEVLAKRS